MQVHFYALANGHYEYKDANEEAKNLAYLESVVREAARCNTSAATGTEFREAYLKAGR